MAFAVLLALAWSSCAIAQPAPATQPASAVSAAQMSIITRSDIAASYRRFDRAYAEHPPQSTEERSRVHRDFDKATLAYFSGKYDQAIHALDDLTDSLLPTDAPRPTPQQRLIRSLQVRIAPQTALQKHPSILRIRITPMYTLPQDQRPDAPVDLRLVIRSAGADGAVILDLPQKIDPSGSSITLAQKQPPANIGEYTAELIAPDGTRYIQQHWPVVDVPLDVTRTNNERRLKDLRAADEAIRQALATCRARNALITDRPDLNSSPQFLSDPLDTARRVNNEIGSLAQGFDPYSGFVGLYWRAIVAGGMQMPAVVYAPAQVKDATKSKPLPLVIALHGEGIDSGDECSFTQFYGDGQIKTLADKHGFVVVAPSTVWVNNNAAALESIINAMACVYPIDPTRVYLIGHSRGGAAAIEMASLRPEKVAGVALFNSVAGLDHAQSLPPTIVFQGTQDPLLSVKDTQRVIEQSRSATRPIEFRLADGAGHTLIVNDRLPEAVEWLMSKQRTSVSK